MDRRGTTIIRDHTSGPRHAAGVTLLEILIVLAIVGILAVIAVPSYQEGVRKSRRVDAMDSLLELASQQERFYARTGTYTTEVAAATGLNFGSTVSPDDDYALAVAACTGGTIAQCYRITATPLGDQVNDTRCGTFTLDSRAGKSASGVDGANCW
jgi:type IV pilus assembly protein PilE